MYYLYYEYVNVQNCLSELHCVGVPLPAPANVTNADIRVECSYALYSCREGYYSNGASSYIVFDGQASSSAMECRLKSI